MELHQNETGHMTWRDQWHQAGKDSGNLHDRDGLGLANSCNNITVSRAIAVMEGESMGQLKGTNEGNEEEK